MLAPPRSKPFAVAGAPWRKLLIGAVRELGDNGAEIRGVDRIEAAGDVAVRPPRLHPRLGYHVRPETGRGKFHHSKPAPWGDLGSPTVSLPIVDFGFIVFVRVMALETRPGAAINSLPAIRAGLAQVNAVRGTGAGLDSGHRFASKKARAKPGGVTDLIAPRSLLGG